MRNPLSLEAFADWCEKQPGKRYFYLNSKTCAVSEYAASLGLPNPYDLINDYLPVCDSPFWCAADKEAQHHSTFGALASRLRASIQEA